MNHCSTDHETTPVEDPDAPLVARAQAGERAAFDVLVARHFDTIQKAIYRRCHDRAEAHDHAQESFLRAWLNIRSFRGESAVFSTWLHGVAYRVAYTHEHYGRGTRKRRRDTLQYHGLPHDGAENWFLAACGVTPSIEDELIEAERAAVLCDACASLRAAVAALPPERRDAVVLCDLEERTLSDAAQTLQCAEGTLKSRRARARKTLALVLTGVFET